MGELRKAINELNKKLPGSVMKLGDCAYKDIGRVSTGSFALNLETGGGYPKGGMVILWGALSSGKTALSLKAIAEVQKMNKPAAYIDLENTLDVKWAKKLGVDVDNLLISQPESAEQTADIVDSLVRSKELGILVIDSLASMVPQVEIDESAFKQQMGVAARITNKMIRKIHSALQPKEIKGKEIVNECVVILINQVREKIGVMYGNPETMPGGRGSGFGSSMTIRLRKGIVLKQKEEVIGQEMRFKVEKNKTYPPYRVGSFDFYYKDGRIDNIKSIIQYAAICNLIKRKGAWYYYGKKKFNGQVALIDYLRSDNEIIDTLEKQILQIRLNHKG